MSDVEYFGDREILKDLLVSEKHLSGSYNICVNESTSKTLGHILENILNETHKMHWDISSAMMKRGWYRNKYASSRDIEMIKHKYKQLD